MNHAALTTTAPPNGDGLALLKARVSFGTDIQRPSQLVTRTTGELLRAVRDGAWSEEIQKLRALPDDSSAQRKAKLQLPYVTWAGEFSRRDGAHLMQHAGQVGVDLDHLAPPQTHWVMHTALDDPHCLAAFRSASGCGVRLLIKVPPAADAAAHDVRFAAAAQHVRSRYEVEPDDCGSDLARASFISWDGGLWLNPQAVTLRIEELATLNNGFTHCLTGTGPCRNRVPWFVWLAREYLPHRSRGDGTMETHFVLLRLGLRLALWARREGIWMREDHIDSTCDAWLREVQRRGLKLRGAPDEYRSELREIISGARRCRWFSRAADTWTRWTSSRDCPSDAKGRLLFAIRGHCAEAGVHEFFLSSFDAARITGTSHTHALAQLRALCAEGKLRRVKKRRPARHAITYRLVVKVSEDSKNKEFL